MLVCLTLVSCGQTPKNKPTSDITNTKTTKHLNIPGTRVFVIPPAGFVTSTTLPAFEKGNQGLLQAMDVAGGNYYTNAATFSKEKFEQKGVEVLEYKEFKINSYPARMVLIQGDPQTKMYSLVLGDSTFSTSVMGVFATDDNQTGEQIKQAIQSIYYDKTFEVNPFATAPFKLDDTKSIFKFAKFSASMYMYSIGGVKKDAYDNEPYFMALAAPTEGETLKAIADDMANVIKDATMKNISETKTNGLQSFRREVYGTLNGKAAVLFQQVVKIGESAVIMQGVADDNFEKYISEFEKLANTVSKK